MRNRSIDSLAGPLLERATKLALARAEMHLRAARREAGRWRLAHLLWPTFTDRSS